jgi:tetratricopeptide (TPR) repeat protein
MGIELKAGDILQILKDIFKDPIVYGPMVIFGIFIIIGIIRKFSRKTLLISAIMIFLYSIGAIIYSNYNFVRIVSKTTSGEPGRAIIAVLCFYNVAKDKNYDVDCNLFRYHLTRSLKLFSGKYGLDVINHEEIIRDPKLCENASLAEQDAIQIGKEFGSNYVIYGEISPIKDILIRLNILKIETGKSILDFEIGRRITDISALARKASKEILFNLKEIHDPEKRQITNRLSSGKTTIKAWKYFSEGLDNFLRKNYGESISALKKSIKEDKSFPDPHYLLTFIYFGQKQDYLAIEELVETINLDPKWADPHYFLGVIYKKNGRYLEAKVEYEKALDLEDRLVYKITYETALAGAFLKLGKVEEAKKIINEIEEAQIKNRKILHNLAARYCELGKLDKALSLLKEAKNAGLTEYDCGAALTDPDFGNFKNNLTKYRQFQELMKQCN